MKRLGLISYKNHSGLGVIAANFRKWLPLASQFVIKHPVKDAPGETYDIGIPHTFGDLEPTIDQLNEYLDVCKPEVVIVIETPFNFDFFQIMYDRGIKVVLIPMIDSVGVEKFIPYEKYIDLVINFTKVGQKIYAEHWPGGNINGIHLPYPIDTEYFCLLGGETEFTFVHSSGWGGSHYRKSTDLVFTAFQQLSHKYKDITMLVNSQCGEQEHSQLRNVERVTIQRKDLPEAIDSYRNGPVCIFPSRREGLGLPILEAMACGLPVITTDAPPMNEWFPEDYSLLVKVQCQTDLPYGDVPMYTPSAFDLMKKMEYAYNNPKLMEQIGETNRIIIQEKFSWPVLRNTYLEFLNR